MDINDVAYVIKKVVWIDFFVQSYIKNGRLVPLSIYICHFLFHFWKNNDLSIIELRACHLNFHPAFLLTNLQFHLDLDFIVSIHLKHE